jgi:hypothetical protein
MNVIHQSKPLKTITPWFGVHMIIPLFAILGWIYAAVHLAWVGLILCSLYLFFIFRIWRYKFEYYPDRIIVKRFFYSNIVLLKSEIDYFCEMQVLPGTKLDHGPQVVMKSQRRHRLPCGISIDQRKLLEFLINTYEKEVESKCTKD